MFVLRGNAGAMTAETWRTLQQGGLDIRLPIVTRSRGNHRSG